MSVSFWINLVVCIGALVFACLEHTEVRDELRAATENKRRTYGAKLVLLWLLPIATLVATLFSAWESVTSEKEVKGAADSLIITSNRLTQVTQDLERASGKTSELERRLEPRTLTRQQRERFIALSKDCPKVQVRFASNNPSLETIHYMEQLDELLSAAGYQVFERYSDYPDIHPNFVSGQSIGLMVGAPLAPNCAVALKRCMDSVGITSSKNPWILTNSANAVRKGFAIKTNEIVVFVSEKQYAE